MIGRLNRAFRNRKGFDINPKIAVPWLAADRIGLSLERDDTHT